MINYSWNRLIFNLVPSTKIYDLAINAVLNRIIKLYLSNVR